MPIQSAPLNDEGPRTAYQRSMLAIAAGFKDGAPGSKTLKQRAAAIDVLVTMLWRESCKNAPQLSKGMALVAVGGYGRSELFPYSDVDLMFLLDAKVAESTVKDPIRRINQALWDCGLRISPLTRQLSECEKFNPENAEFAFALLDQRFVCGDKELHARLATQMLPKLFEKERDAILRRLAEVTAARHAKYGGTLFHLEPNIKDCPGGLRDVHVCGWIERLLRPSPKRRTKNARSSRTGLETGVGVENHEFREAVAFFQLLRCFLHFRHERDDNTLDWQAQDAAAAAAVGLEAAGTVGAGCGVLDAGLLSQRAHRGTQNGAAVGGDAIACVEQPNWQS